LLISFLAFWFDRYVAGEGMNLIDSLLSLNPLKRPSAKESLNHPYFAEDPRACLPSEYVFFFNFMDYNDGRINTLN
jgi:serine/threonine protein kinase